MTQPEEDDPVAEARAALGRVLLVDDQPELRRMLQRSLSKAGHEVVAAESAHRAIDLLREIAFDVVVSDMHMPELGGLELLRAVHAADPGLPVLIVSGSGTEKDAKDALEQGAFEYLTKPVALRTLRETVAEAIETRRKRATLEYQSATRLRRGLDIDADE